jgi:ubiquinol-cytochrome c reductase cytochrome b subunit
VMFSMPIIGEPLGTLLFETELPSQRFLTIAWAGHVFVLPAAFVGLLVLHLVLVHRRRPALARRPDVDVATTAVGRPLWPDAVARFALLTAGLTALLLLSSALVPWSDLELEGPFLTAEATNSVHPPWALFFLTGGLRVVPAVDLVLGPVRITNVLVAGVIIPGILVSLVALYPFIERRVLKDDGEHHTLDHPLDVPFRAGCVTAITTFTAVFTFGAGVDVLSFWLDVAVETVVLWFQVALVVAPVVLGLMVVHAARRRVQAREADAQILRSGGTPLAETGGTLSHGGVVGDPPGSPTAGGSTPADTPTEEAP